MNKSARRLSFDPMVADIVTRDLMKRVDAGEKPLVPGTVFEITECYNGHVFLYNNSKLLGTISRGAWRAGGSRLFREACKLKKVYDFHVIGYEVKPESEMVLFQLSRENIEKGWKDIITENNIKTGMELKIRLVYKSYDHREDIFCLGGVSDEIKGLEVFVFASELEGSMVMLGDSFRCKITRIDESDCTIYASFEEDITIFRELDAMLDQKH